MKAIFYLMMLVGFVTQNIQGQTCCSGGVPLSGNLGLPIAESKNWQFSASYDLNVLKTLQTETQKLDDNSRKRTTHTAIFQIGYRINEKISFEALLPFVRQERLITPIGLPENFEATNGIGDGVLLAKYRVFKDYQIGIGLKLPTGSSTKNNSQGLPLNADLQPGSGSWDLIYWVSGRQNLKFRPSSTISLVATYRSTGENDSYLGSQVYEFGNEFQAIFGFADQFLIEDQIVNPSIGIKYRNVQNDIVDEFNVPSTGGEWLFIRPGITFVFGRGISFSTIAEIPLSAKIEGTQVTPTYRLNFAFFKTFSNKKKSK